MKWSVEGKNIFSPSRYHHDNCKTSKTSPLTILNANRWVVPETNLRRAQQPVFMPRPSPLGWHQPDTNAQHDRGLFARLKSDEKQNRVFHLSHLHTGSLPLHGCPIELPTGLIARLSHNPSDLRTAPPPFSRIGLAA
jgi:hypothetical protein